MLERRDKLRNHIVEQIQEAMLKLGFARESIYLYYPTDSLNAILHLSCQNAEEMCEILQKELPEFSYGCHDERVEVRIPQEYVEYVHQKLEVPEFLAKFISCFQENPHMSIKQIKKIFAEFGECVFEKMPDDADFDYVLYFKDSKTDAYYYCIRMEMGHTIYHRFIREDYERLIS